MSFPLNGYMNLYVNSRIFCWACGKAAKESRKSFAIATVGIRVSIQMVKFVMQGVVLPHRRLST